MKNRVWMKRFVALVVSFLLSVCVFCSTDNMTFAWLLTCYIWVFAFLACDYKKNIVMLAFMICFFVFLMGRPLMIEMFGYSKYSVVSLGEDTRTQIYVILIISLISVMIGYLLIGFRRAQDKDDDLAQDYIKANRIMCIQKVSKYMTIILYLLVILENILRLIFIRQVGYTSSYSLEGGYVLPFGLHNLVLVAPVAIAVFLATLPNKRKIIVPVILFVMANVISSLAGNRFEIISCVLVLVVYGVWRNVMDGRGWVKGKHVLCLLLVAPMVMVLLQNMIYWREGSDIDSKINPMAEFLYGTGGSSDLIGIVDKYGDRVLDRNVVYSFGGIWRGLNGNFIAQSFGLGNKYGGQTIEYAENAHSLGSTLTYYFYPKKYLSGYGLGGCYIAELYHDFSIPGVVIGNLLIGIIVGLIGKMKKGRILHNFFCIFFITLLLRMPRDSFDYLIVNLLNLKNILFIIFMLLIVKRMERVSSISKNKIMEYQPND